MLFRSVNTSLYIFMIKKISFTGRNFSLWVLYIIRVYYPFAILTTRALYLGEQIYTIKAF